MTVCLPRKALMRCTDDSVGGYFDSTISSKEREAFVNLSAVLDRAAVENTIDWIWSPWVLRATLKSHLPKHDRRDDCNALVRGATMWIIYAGRLFFKNFVTEPVASKAGDGSLMGGDLYMGPMTGIIRWHFWTAAFEELPKERDLSKDAMDLWKSQYM